MDSTTQTKRDELFGRPRDEIEAALPTREAVRCPLCGLDPEPFATDFQGFRLVRCPRCRLEFLSPRPVLESLTEHVYGREYGDLADDAAELTPEKRAAFARQLGRIEASLGRTGGLLDVGCGAGAFLRFARERGWTAAGADIVLSPAAQASGARLWAGQLGAIDFGGARFDAVRFHHVLEHTQDPLADLRCARTVMVSEGVLYISVPNLGGISPRLKSAQSLLGLKAHRWRHYAALHHLWYFTPETLGRLVEAAGFRVLHWETPLPYRAHRPGWLAASYRWVLEKPRLGSILDLYARAA